LKSFGIIRAELRPSGWEYLHEYNDMDIALDTFPWNGGGTTCDALYMGTPVIALEGKAFGDNYAASILKSAGLGELVAKNETEYIELAVELAKDKAALKSLQQNLRTIIEKSPLMNEKMYVKDMEKIYKRLYGKQGKR
jgi:predicted O-linked N-acetylglucosamine transferase (SPINDLY family)